MRIISTNYLNDGKKFNDGRPVDLIEIQDPGDFDILVDNILNSNYYGNQYLSGHLKSKKFNIKQENVCLAAMIHYLQAGSLLELGCAQGEVIFLLDQVGEAEVRGVDLSREMTECLIPELEGKVDTGDILDICRQYHEQQKEFDFFCGFDIWEHIHPHKIDDYIDAVVSIASNDALFLSIIPAFGEDEVFGEIFPLEFKETQDDFEGRRPFRYLIAESIDPIIPVNGHLIWAHTQWWENLFSSHGLRRAKELERLLHSYFGPYLYDSQKTFYLFSKDTPSGRERVNALLSSSLNWLGMWRIFLAYHRALQNYQRISGREMIDWSQMTSRLDDIVYRLYDYQESRIAALESRFNWRQWLGGAGSLWRRTLGK